MAPDPLDALRDECELVSELVLGLPEEDFARPTRLPAWNVKQLLAHMYRDVDRTNTALDTEPPPAADTDAVTYWGRYDPVTDSPDIADRALQVASGYESGQALAAAWDEMWRRALGRAAETPRDRVMVTWGPALTLEEFLRTRVLEITVHRADLNAAVDLPADPTDDGLTISEEILLGLLDPPPPGTAPVEGVALLEIGTGRRDPTGEERQALGDLADRFPLLQ
jgi:uncharacterized protein (TIGR03083 family)